MKTVCERLSAMTGVTLSAAKPIEDDLIILYAKGKPSKEVMARIAAHFGWEWQKEGGGYRIIQSPKARQAELDALADQLVEPVRGVRDTCVRFFKETPDAEALTKRLKELNDLISKFEEQMPDQDEFDPDYQVTREQRKLYSERARLESYSDPMTIFINKVFSGLSDRQLVELATRGRIVLSYRPTPSQKPLGATGNRAAERFVHDYLALAKEKQAENSGAELDEFELEYGYKLFDPTQVTAVRVAFTYESNAMMSMLTSRVNADIAVLGPNLTVLWSDYELLSQNSPSEMFAEQLEEKPAQPPIEPKQRGRLDEPLKLSDEDKRNIITTPEKAMARMFGLAEGGSEPLVPVGKTFAAIAAGSNSCIVADCYDGYISMVMSPMQPRTAASFFDGVSQLIDTSWQFEGDWISVRANKWQRARAASVPRSAFTRILDALSANGSLSVDEQAKIAADLTYLQFSSPLLQLMQMSSAMMVGSSSNHETYHLLRFWNALTLPQKMSMKAGGKLAYITLTPEAQTSFSEFLFLTGEDENAGEGALSMLMGGDEEEEEEAMPGVQIEEEMIGPPEGVEMVESEEPDTEITQVMPTGPTANSVISANLVTVPALMMSFTIMGEKASFAVPIAIYAEAIADTKSVEEFQITISDKVKAGTFETWTFIIETPNGVTRTGKLLGVGFPADARAVPVSELPQELQQQITKAVERAKKRAAQRASEPPPT